MPYIGPNTQIIAARENTRGTKAALGSSSPEKRTVIGFTDRQVEMPDWEQDWKKYKTHGNLREILRQVPSRTSFGPASIPIVPLDGFMFYQAIGREYVTGTAVGGGGSTTLSGAEAVGSTALEVASAANFAVADYVQIAGTNAAGRNISEIHRIASIAGSTLTIDSPGLRYPHSAGVAVTEVTAPYEHVLEPIAGVNHPTMTLQALLNVDDDDSARFMRSFLGAQVHSWELTGEDPEGDGGDLRLETRIASLDVADDTSVPSSYSRASFPDKDPFMFYHTAGLVTVAGRTFGTVQDFGISHDNRPKTKRYFGSSSGQKPSRYLNQFPDYSFRMTIVPDGFLSSHSNSIYDLLRGRTKADIVIPFLRDGAASYAASTDALQIELGNCSIMKAPHSMPIEDEITVSCDIMPTTIKFKIKDSTPMYATL